MRKPYLHNETLFKRHLNLEMKIYLLSITFLKKISKGGFPFFEMGNWNNIIACLYNTGLQFHLPNCNIVCVFYIVQFSYKHPQHYYSDHHNIYVMVVVINTHQIWYTNIVQCAMKILFSNKLYPSLCYFDGLSRWVEWRKPKDTNLSS